MAVIAVEHKIVLGPGAADELLIADLLLVDGFTQSQNIRQVLTTLDIFRQLRVTVLVIEFPVILRPVLRLLLDDQRLGARYNLRAAIAAPIVDCLVLAVADLTLDFSLLQHHICLLERLLTDRVRRVVRILLRF